MSYQENKLMNLKDGRLLLETLDERKTDVITDTASGEIASFPDGANGMPVKSLVVNVEPVQDLHGQESPYPAGGGKNILPPLTSGTKNGVSIAVASDGTITVNGTASENTYFDAAASGVIPNNTTFYLYAFNPVASTDSNNMSVFIITNNGNQQVNLNSVNASTSYSYNTGDRQISKWRFKVPAGVAYTNFVLKPMFQIGGTAPTAYAPYSNICPISGWDSANVSRTGVNVWDEQCELGILNSDGSAGSSSNRLLTGYISVVPGETYYLTGEVGRGRGAYYDKDKNFLSYYADFPNSDKTFTVPSNAKYLRYCLTVAYGSTYNHDVSFNYPATDTQYHAYSGSTAEYEFPQEAGTVYGGTLTIHKDGTGELVVDRAIVDMGSLVYSKTSSPSASGGSVFGINVSKVGYGMAARERYAPNTMISDVYGTAQSTIWWVKDIQDFEMSVNGSVLYIADSRYEDADTFKTAMSGVHLVYELATPVTVQLTGTALATLLGQNNVWADCGAVSVEYPCDTKLYIDKKLTASRNLMELVITANHEDSMKATKAYSTGNLLIVNGALYKATTSIANGATLTVGTNVSATTIANELAALA